MFLGRYSHCFCHQLPGLGALSAAGQELGEGGVGCGFFEEAFVLVYVCGGGWVGVVESQGGRRVVAGEERRAALVGSCLGSLLGGGVVRLWERTVEYQMYRDCVSCAGRDWMAASKHKHTGACKLRTGRSLLSCRLNMQTSH